jgi:dihydrofolate synthase/folylpolyglutamate synthase
MPARDGSPEYVFDVAHNPAGAWALRSTLSAGYPDRSLTFVFGAMRDKAIGEMAEILFPLADGVIVARADNPRSASPQEIREAAARTSTARATRSAKGKALRSSKWSTVRQPACSASWSSFRNRMLHSFACFLALRKNSEKTRKKRKAR